MINIIHFDRIKRQLQILGINLTFDFGFQHIVFHTQKKKKLPKCVSGQLESFKTHLFLGEKRGYPYSSPFWPKFHEFCNFF